MFRLAAIAAGSAAGRWAVLICTSRARSSERARASNWRMKPQRSGRGRSIGSALESVSESESEIDVCLCLSHS